MGLSRQLKKILWITIAWTGISLFNYLIGWAALVDANYIWDANYDMGKIDHVQGLYISVLTSIFAGIIGGGAIVFLWEKWLRSKPYGWTLRSIFISYLIIFNLVTLPIILFNNTYGKSYGFFTRQAWQHVETAYTSPSLLVPFFFWLIVVLVTLIVFQVNDKYGPGVFKKFLLGKYFNPTREERIFMFLDLRSSTTIAENLGEEQYFNFLKEVFQTVTPAILKHKGEIYQYVGDEMVISWEKGLGVKNNRCITCYFDAQQLLNEKEAYFTLNYGVRPEFKAGLHYGHVMAGEIGVIKREIAYSGDVLNTTARIQSKCNEHGVNILISDALIEQLSLTAHKLKNLGHIELRGKSESVRLYALDHPN
ncbi:adenylate/guanylate cyclase domain-containing protein [Ekhidna sp. To15]|uniref:adenylate/guanylate cyclase domain-containing protein n=1 Tax=Ekhidna sp. To15 TaxID=3395267 RepID=UPI003F526F3F